MSANLYLCRECVEQKPYAPCMGDGYCKKHGCYPFYELELTVTCTECAREKNVCQRCGKKVLEVTGPVMELDKPNANGDVFSSKDELVDKIVKLYEEMKSPALIVLKTPHAGDTVNNGCGLDFELSPYAVIHDGEKDFKRLYDFEQENHTDIMSFEAASCSPSIDALAQELHNTDGYEIVWRKDQLV